MGITPEEFYDMSPVEHYWAMQSVSTQQEAEGKTTLIAARLQAWLVINHIPFMKKRYRTPDDLIKFGEKKGDQSVDEMKRILYAMAGKKKKDD